MVSASSAAAAIFTARPITITEPAASTMPKPSASPGATRPAGIGRPLVRDITASMSRSYHMLMAPDAPAPTAMHRIAVSARTGCRCPGASSMPVRPVKTTSDITRGFRSATKSPTEAPPRSSATPPIEMSLKMLSPRLLLDDRDLVEGVERRRRGNLPLQRRRADAPRILRDALTRGQRAEDDEDEEQGRGEGD